MGCHTWFYIEQEPPHIERSVLLTNINDFCDEMIEFCKDYKKYYRDASKEELEYTKYAYESYYPELKRIINNYQFSLDTLLRFYYRHCRNDYTYNKNRGTYVVTSSEYHDLFRRYDYPNDVLTSFDEAWMYYMDPKNKCKGEHYENNCWVGMEPAGINEEVDNYVKTQLKKFFNDNPNGYINFG